MPIQAVPIPEKIRVFVSSSISECSKDRKVARSAIYSLNHEPVLFEQTGARPNSPREWYLRKIDEAHIFIGVYRNGYGYIAKGMSISGLEDEYQHAILRGMECLAYVNREDTQRDQRLRSLLEEMKPRLKICFYREADELYERIREDVAAVVAQRFHEAESLEALLRIDAGGTIESFFPPGGHLIERTRLESEILAALSRRQPVQVVGPIGIGKTVLLATLARRNGFVFTCGSHLSRKELAGVLANKLAGPTKHQVSYFADANQAYRALVNVWKSTQSFTIVLDDCRDSQFLTDLLREVGGVDERKRLIYSVRKATDNLDHTRISVPPLSRDEVVQLVSQSRGAEIGSAELEKLYESSQGNPLYVRYYLAGKPGEYRERIADFETLFWNSLDARGREIIGYLSIANTRLSIEELIQLVGGPDTSIEEIAGEVEKARFFVSEDSFGYSILHEHLRDTILSMLSSQPHRHAYYARRVAEILVKQGDYTRAYFALEGAGDREGARRIARSAEFDASRKGDFGRLVYILEHILSDIRKEGDPEEIVLTLLALSQAKQFSGWGSEALDILSEAIRVAEASQNKRLILRTREAKIWNNVVRLLDVHSLTDLRQLKHIYQEAGDEWSSARVSVDLSALLIRLDRYSEAKNEAQEGLEIFERLGDEYGVSIAKRNLISALSGVPEEEKRVGELIRDLEEKDTGSSTVRERAWLCNVMGRRFRKAGDYERARKYASEAIDIGMDLGDSYIVTISRINLGNVLRDQGKLVEALNEYVLASGEAQRSGNRDIEATSTRIIASIYNRMKKADLAVQHATYAASLVRGTLGTDELAYSLEELGDAYDLLKRPVDAANSYIEAATAMSARGDLSETCRLGLQGLSIFVARDLSEDYIRGVDTVFGITLDGNSTRKKPVGEQFFDRVPYLIDSVDRHHLIPLLGLHFSQMFKEVPSPVGRFLFERVSKMILEHTADLGEAWKAFFPFIPLLVSLPKDFVQMEDLVAIGDQLHERVEGVHFKPYSDGSGHWVVSLKFTQSVICSITTMDDRIDTSIAAALLAFFLKGFEKDIQDDIILAEKLGQDEVSVFVGNVEAAPEDIKKYLLPSLKEQTCAVSTPTRPTTDLSVPTYVFCRSDIAEQWHAGSGRASSMQLLLGLALREIVYRLFRGEVELDTLHPKVIQVVRKTVS